MQQIHQECNSMFGNVAEVEEEVYGYADNDSLKEDLDSSDIIDFSSVAFTW